MLVTQRRVAETRLRHFNSPKPLALGMSLSLSYHTCTLTPATEVSHERRCPASRLNAAHQSARSRLPRIPNAGAQVHRGRPERRLWRTQRTRIGTRPVIHPRQRQRQRRGQLSGDGAAARDCARCRFWLCHACLQPCPGPLFPAAGWVRFSPPPAPQYSTCGSGRELGLLHALRCARWKRNEMNGRPPYWSGLHLAAYSKYNTSTFEVVESRAV